MERSIIDLMLRGKDLFLPSLSVDCVIFGFHAGELRVLLLQGKYDKKWSLPGGFVGINESVEEAASRVLFERTQLKGLFLQWFGIFGAANRPDHRHLRSFLEDHLGPPPDDHWLLQRFVSAGYFALVEFNKVKPSADDPYLACTWHNVTELPVMAMDHRSMVEQGLRSMRQQINHQPIGYNLLPREFPLKELQSIYESVLGKKLDRSNFQRKILSFGILDRREKLNSGDSHRPPYLYAFNKKKYMEALKNGLHKDW